MYRRRCSKYWKASLVVWPRIVTGPIASADRKPRQFERYGLEILVDSGLPKRHSFSTGGDLGHGAGWSYAKR